MRVCLLGDFTGRPDEGMKNISMAIRDMLSIKHNVLALNSREVLTKKFFRKIRLLRPEMIHYLHGPTIRSLIILKVVKYLSGSRPKTIISATRPYFSIYSWWAVTLFKPDLLFTQSSGFEDFFKKKGCQVEFLPNGVDCDKFNSINETEKLSLRKQFNLLEDKKIVLHVGHIKANRNLEIFKKIQKLPNIQVIIIGGTTEKADENIKKDLEKSGVKVFHKYFEDISQFYKMSDLYIFPVKDSGNKLPISYNQVGAIDLPLSVMEAMACNLPVITTPFGALSRLFKSGDGLFFCETEEEIIYVIQQLSYKGEIATRDKVLPHDWRKVIKRLEKIYQEIVL